MYLLEGSKNWTKLYANKFRRRVAVEGLTPCCSVCRASCSHPAIQENSDPHQQWLRAKVARTATLKVVNDNYDRWINLANADASLLWRTALELCGFTFTCTKVNYQFHSTAFFNPLESEHLCSTYPLVYYVAGSFGSDNNEKIDISFMHRTLDILCGSDVISS